MLSVLDIKQNRPFQVWIGITLFCILFAAVYEMFSFGVYSLHMILMFLYPLLLGALPCLFFRQGAGRFWNDGILLLTGGSLLSGVLEIYGTSSSLTDLILRLGISLLILDPVLIALKKAAAARKQNG